MEKVVLPTLPLDKFYAKNVSSIKTEIIVCFVACCFPSTRKGSGAHGSHSTNAC